MTGSPLGRAAAGHGPNSDALVSLRQSVVFGDLDDGLLLRIAACLTPRQLEPGEVLTAEGDPPDGAWIVVTGRLEVSTGRDGDRRTLAILGPGNLVGEMGLLSGSPRSATVTAIRHTKLLCLSGDDFERLVVDDARVLWRVARTVVRRLDRAIHQTEHRSTPSVIAVLPAGDEPEHTSFARCFDELAEQSVALVDTTRIKGELGARPSEGEVIGYLHNVEATADLTLLVADHIDSLWTRRCIRHADLHLLVGGADGLGRRNPVEAVLVEEWPSHGNAETHLVIVHDRAQRRSTAFFRSLRDVDRHHHVHAWSPADLRRLGRVISGKSVGLVLGGGGAKGFAHLGVIKALAEHGIPIDHIGGASIGAVVAGIYAMGWEWEEMVRQARRVTVERRSLLDVSFPAIALATGARLKTAIRDLFGDSDLEDMGVDFFCASTDLSSGTLRVHTTGPMWWAVRASVAIPGLFPPVPTTDGQLLVDGGVLNNVPADVLADLFSPQTVIASDVQAVSRLPMADLAVDGVISGWAVAGHRYLRRSVEPDVPHMADVLMSASAVSGRHAADAADLVFRPPVGDHAMLDFQAHADILDAGYRHATEVLENWEEHPGSYSDAATLHVGEGP